MVVAFGLATASYLDSYANLFVVWILDIEPVTGKQSCPVSQSMYSGTFH